MQDFPPTLGSDNHSGVHPLILSALQEANVGHCASYGTDPITERCLRKFNEVFGDGIDVYFVFGGTAANLLAIRTLTDSFEAVICTRDAHIHVDECAGPEATIGRKLLLCSPEHAKLEPEHLAEHLIRRGDQHFAQPRLVSVTQSTELGTVYSRDELRSLCDAAHARDLLVHVDGARISNAAASLGCSLRELTRDVGVDALSFGGTKNGLMFGECVVFFDRSLSKQARYYRKQLAQLPSKMRFIAAQFDRYLTDELWRDAANHANTMAQRLYQAVQDHPRIRVTHPVQANAVFAEIPKEFLKPLREIAFFYEWNEATHEVRWMTTFDTTREDIERFVARLRTL